MTAFVYVRKSVADDPNAFGIKVQRDRVLALAAAHGEEHPEVVEDIDISGAKVEQRVGYMRIRSAIESGEATAIYAFDLSRLHRNTTEALAFFKLAEKQRVAIRLVEGGIDTSGPTGELMLTILSAMNAWVSNVASAKIKAALAARVAEGLPKNGGRPYANPMVVVDAYRATGSLTRAARKLNEDGVPTRNARSRGWSASAVSSVVRREAPDLIVPGESRGRPTSRPFRFARLLRCSVCGARMTPSYDAKRDHTSYYCHTADTMPHGQKRVSETGLARAIQPEADRWIASTQRVPTDRNASEVAKLDALERQVDQLAASGLDVSSLRNDIEARRAAVAPSRRRSRVPVVELRLAGDVGAGDPAAVNIFLRRMLDHVVVDMSGGHERGEVQITEAAWRDPARRANGVA